MNTCKNCPYPRRCQAQERCIAFKIGAQPVEIPDPIPQPIDTTSGTRMSGLLKKAKKKK